MSQPQPQPQSQPQPQPQLYGSVIKSSSAQRYVYQRADTDKLASVNHVTRDPTSAAEIMKRDGKSHTEYVPLGSYLGPDTPQLAQQLDRMQKSSATNASKPSARSLPKVVRRT